MGRTETPAPKAMARLLRFLGAGDARAAASTKRESLLLDGGDRGTIAVERDLVGQALRAGLVEMDKAGWCRLGKAAKTARQDGGSETDALAVDRREPVAAAIAGPQGPDSVTINLAESPLAQLAGRRDRRGGRFLTVDEVAAGEQLRRDYERACIMPRLGIDWEKPIAKGVSSNAGRGALDLTEAILAARMRVEKAIEAVGPELAGILIDVCCFLKGLQRVEAERGWPARSAKVMLKTALGALDRHYRPRQGMGRRTFQWGTPDYRPTRAGPDPS